MRYVDLSRQPSKAQTTRMRIVNVLIARRGFATPQRLRYRDNPKGMAPTRVRSVLQSLQGNEHTCGLRLDRTRPRAMRTYKKALNRFSMSKAF